MNRELWTAVDRYFADTLVGATPCCRPARKAGCRRTTSRRIRVGCSSFSLVFAWALRLSRPGTLIIVDNVVRNGAVVDAASDDPIVQGVRRLNDAIAAEPRVSAAAIQTVGSKGYDGMAIVLVND
jgi:hypothetical protein